MPSLRVVKVKQFLIKRITVDEAIDQMELLDHDFFLFVNNQNNVLSLVYRRYSGDYGLIEPEIAE
jgi:putative sigma-54 modulation protein